MRFPLGQYTGVLDSATKSPTVKPAGSDAVQVSEAERQAKQSGSSQEEAKTPSSGLEMFRQQSLSSTSVDSLKMSTSKDSGDALRCGVEGVSHLDALKSYTDDMTSEEVARYRKHALS